MLSVTWVCESVREQTIFAIMHKHHINANAQVSTLIHVYIYIYVGIDVVHMSCICYILYVVH